MIFLKRTPFMKEKRINGGLTVNLVERSGEEFGLRVSSPDGTTESKTEPWALPADMLKPGGPSPLNQKVVPENKKRS